MVIESNSIDFAINMAAVINSGDGLAISRQIGIVMTIEALEQGTRIRIAEAVSFHIDGVVEQREQEGVE